MRPSSALTLLLTGAVLLALAATPAASAEPIRVASKAFGRPIEIEVRNLPMEQAELAIQEALRELAELEALTDRYGKAADGIAALNASSEGLVIDRRLLRLLARARDFCQWSRGSSGPLAGRLYDLWGLHGEGAEAIPTPASLAATATPACGGLLLNADTALARRPEGAQIDLWGFAAGFAVDRAIEVLQDFGATNAVVEVGSVVRAIGKGPDGRRGWPVQMREFEGTAETMETRWLEDQALAFIHRLQYPLAIAGDSYTPFLDQRTGMPAQGVRGALVVTVLAGDAQALAVSLSILGPKEGQMRLGGLKPVPAVLWLLGEGTEGPPLLAAYHWSQATRRQP